MAHETIRRVRAEVRVYGVSRKSLRDLLPTLSQRIDREAEDRTETAVALHLVIAIDEVSHFSAQPASHRERAREHPVYNCRSQSSNISLVSLYYDLIK